EVRLLSLPRIGLTDTVETGMRSPTLNSASALLRTNTEGVDSRRTSETRSRAVMMAAASFLNRVQDAPSPVALPPKVLQLRGICGLTLRSRPGTPGTPMPPFSMYHCTP